MHHIPTGAYSEVTRAPLQAVPDHGVRDSKRQVHKAINGITGHFGIRCGHAKYERNPHQLVIAKDLCVPPSNQISTRYREIGHGKFVEEILDNYLCFTLLPPFRQRPISRDGPEEAIVVSALDGRNGLSRNTRRAIWKHREAEIRAQTRRN